MQDSDIRNIIEHELSTGEKLLWSGAPQKAYRPPLLVFYLIFISFWLCFVLVFLVAGLSQLGKDPIGALFVAVPVFMFLFGLLFFRMTYKALRRPGKQIYGLTNRRGLIIENYGRGPIRSLGPDDLANLTRKGDPSMGSLQFQGPRFSQFSFDLSNLAGVAFYNIANPKNVENIIFNKILQNRSNP